PHPVPVVISLVSSFHVIRAHLRLLGLRSRHRLGIGRRLAVPAAAKALAEFFAFLRRHLFPPFSHAFPHSLRHAFPHAMTHVPFPAPSTASRRTESGREATVRAPARR